MTDDPIKHTIDIYDRAAQQYLERDQRFDPARIRSERFVNSLPAGSKVLDLGCGAGKYLRRLRDSGLWAIGADLSYGLLALNMAGKPLIQADMRHLPFKNAAFDGIWMNASLLHLPRDQAPQAVIEVQRILHPGGYWFLSVKRGDGEAFKEGIGGDRFYTYYERDQLAALVSDFQIVEEWQYEFNDLWIAFLLRWG